MVMPFPNVNLAAVIVATIFSYFLGGIWYSLGRVKLMNLFGKKMEERREPPVVGYAVAFIVTLILSYALAVFIGYAAAKSALAGAAIGFGTWVGFVITMSSADVVFEAKPVKLYLLDSGFQLIAFLGMGAIIGAWT